MAEPQQDPLAIPEWLDRREQKSDRTAGMFKPLSPNEAATPPMQSDRPNKVPIVPVPDDAPPMSVSHHEHGDPTSIWQYEDDDGRLIGYMCRWDFVNTEGKQDKVIWPVSFCKLKNGEQAWRAAGFPVPRPLYALSNIRSRSDATVLITEGEKACDAAASIFPDYVTTTPPHGAKSPHKTDWTPLRDRRVVIWPDHDQDGAEFAEAVARLAIEAGAAEVHIVRVPVDFPPKWDLADPPPDGWTTERIVPLLEEGLLSVLSVPQWGDPRPLPRKLPEAPALPRDLLPASLRPWISDASERAQVPLEYIAVPVLVTLGSIVGRSVGIHPKAHDDWLVTPNLWGMLIGRPGVLKTAAINEALGPIRQLAGEAQSEHEEDNARHEARRQIAMASLAATKEAAKAAAKKGDSEALAAAQNALIAANRELKEAETHERRYMTNDGTVEKIGELLNQNPRGLLVVRDELSGWLRNLEKTGREGDREFYLEAWNGNGRFTYDRIGRGTLHIDALCLSIVGTIQPGKLQSHIAATMAGGAGDDGLLQRFQMPVWPDNTGEWKNVDRSPNANARERALKVFRALDTIKGKDIGAVETSEGVPALRYSTEGQELFDAWRAEAACVDDQIPVTVQLAFGYEASTDHVLSSRCLFVQHRPAIYAYDIIQPDHFVIRQSLEGMSDTVCGLVAHALIIAGFSSSVTSDLNSMRYTKMQRATWASCTPKAKASRSAARAEWCVTSVATPY